MSGGVEVLDRARRQRVRLSELQIRHVWPLWAALTALMYTGLDVYARRGKYGLDAHAYWLTGQRSNLYTGSLRALDLYHYSPAFAQAIRPLTMLAWPAFYAVWVCVETAAFVWLLAPLGWAWGVPAFLLCGFEMYQGNVIALLGVALVVGLRRFPEAWAFAALTKVTIALGPVWFLVRGEWTKLGRAALATALVAGVSAMFAPNEWAAWLRLLTAHQGLEPTFPYRLAAAVALTAYAARRDRAWLLAPAMVLAAPVTQGLGQYLTLLAAVPRLRAGSAERAS